MKYFTENSNTKIVKLSFNSRLHLHLPFLYIYFKFEVCLVHTDPPLHGGMVLGFFELKTKNFQQQKQYNSSFNNEENGYMIKYVNI